MKQIDVVRIFKALSNEQRLKVFKFIYEWNETCQGDRARGDGAERCFTRACGLLNLSRSTISHHMKELEHAGLIIVTRHGQSNICRVNSEAVEAIHNFLS